MNRLYCNVFRRSFSHSSRFEDVRSYKSSIDHLNTLQSNAQTISALRASGAMNKNAIPEMREWLRKSGVQQLEIDDLKVLHVAGTKGKGSTCAMISSILSNYRLAYGKTPRIGLYTSPHLKSVRERIQIDGQPIPEDEWTEYFYEIWDNLSRSGPEKPVYFRFLTILAFHTFIQECVDVVVLECGVGGEHDSTNVVAAPVAAGITSLGIDHIHVLGNTIEEIAWHKAGIFKADCPAFSVPQPSTAQAVLERRAKECGAKSFEIVPVHPALDTITLGLAGSFQKSNASLAITLANAFLTTQGVDENLSVALPAEFLRGLETVKWPGRCETRVVRGREWCLDGAHTRESLTMTGEWFVSSSASTPSSSSSTTATLIFNQQSRDAVPLLHALYKATQSTPHHHHPPPPFKRAIFCTNKTYRTGGFTAELTSLNHSHEAMDSLAVQRDLADAWRDLTGGEAVVVESIEEAIDAVTKAGNGGERTGDGDAGARKLERVLVTGSLHLVGGVMTVLDRES